MAKNIIIAILLIVDICMMIVLLQVNSNNNTIIRQQYVNQNLAYDYRLTLQNDESRFFPNDIAIEDPQKNQVFIDSIIGNCPKLVIRYSSLNCHTCIDSLVTNAKNLSQILGRDNICIFAKYHSDSDFRVFWRTNNNYFRIFQAESQITRLDSINKPYMFVLNSNKTISHIFLPHKEIPEMTKWYLDIVTNHIKTAD